MCVIVINLFNHEAPPFRGCIATVMHFAGGASQISYELYMKNVNEEKDFGEALFDICLSTTKNTKNNDVDTSVEMPIELTNLSVRRHDSRTVSGDVCLSLYFAEAPNEDCEVEVKCFNDDYLPMGKASTGNCGGNKPVKLLLKSDYAWLPDVYTFVVYYCCTPIGAYTFNYDGRQFECIGHGKTTPQSREGIIEEMGINQQSLTSFFKTPGVACVVDTAIESAKSSLLRKWRRYNNNAYTPVNRCFVVYDKKFALPQLLCMRDLLEVDVEKICASVLTKVEIDDFEQTLKNEFHGIIVRNISPLLVALNAVLVKQMLYYLEKDIEWTMVLCGTKQEIDALFATYPALKRHFDGCLPLQYQIRSEVELVHYVSSVFNYFKYVMSAEAELLVQQVVKRDAANLGLGSNALQLINDKLMAIIKGRLNKRLFDEYDRHSENVERQLSVVTAADLRDLAFERRADGFAESMSELNNLIGLKTLKEDISFAINKVRFMDMRRRAGLKSTLSMPNHMVFTGNPGTGKTTVAKMIGKVFHSMGLLSQGDVVVTERSKLVGRYIGDTENNVNEVLALARGNVLFIDEAYTLYNGRKEDFGLRVIESLLTVLAQPDPDMIVILAGYEKEMNEMMSSNPGLKGRFPHKFRFPDYDADELTTIAMRLLGQLDYVLDAEAEMGMKATIAKVVAEKDACFSNARWVAEYVENVIVSNVAQRVAKQYGLSGCVDADELRTVRAEDVVLNVPSEHVLRVPVRRTVGFAV